LTPSPSPSSNPISNNPNAATAGSTTGVTVLILWFLTNVWPKVPISAELGATIAGAVATAALWIGRDGVCGIWRRILHGGGQRTP
jgi:hypothetical protein